MDLTKRWPLEANVFPRCTIASRLDGATRGVTTLRRYPNFPETWWCSVYSPVLLVSVQAANKQGIQSKVKPEVSRESHPLTCSTLARSDFSTPQMEHRVAFSVVFRTLPNVRFACLYSLWSNSQEFLSSSLIETH